MSNLTNLLQATLTSTDGSNNIPVTRGVGNPSFGATTGEFVGYFLVPTAGVDAVINLPVTPVQQVYIKNNAAPASGDLTVKWTPQGGAAATIILLKPGSVLLLWEIVVGGGISALSLNPSVNLLPVEFFLGG